MRVSGVWRSWLIAASNCVRSAKPALARRCIRLKVDKAARTSSGPRSGISSGSSDSENASAARSSRRKGLATDRATRIASPADAATMTSR